MRLFSLLLCLSLIAACGKPAGDTVAEAMIEQSTGDNAEVERSDKQVDIRVKDAHVQIAQAGQVLALPADFPADVYRPDGFRVRHVMNVPRITTVMGEAPGARETLFAQARATMAQQGWKEIRAGQLGTADSAAFRKDGRETVMSFMERDGVVQLSLQLHTPKRKS